MHRKKFLRKVHWHYNDTLSRFFDLSIFSGLGSRTLLPVVRSRLRAPCVSEPASIAVCERKGMRCCWLAFHGHVCTCVQVPGWFKLVGAQEVLNHPSISALVETRRVPGRLRSFLRWSPCRSWARSSCFDHVLLLHRLGQSSTSRTSAGPPSPRPGALRGPPCPQRSPRTPIRRMLEGDRGFACQIISLWRACRRLAWTVRDPPRLRQCWRCSESDRKGC